MADGYFIQGFLVDTGTRLKRCRKCDEVKPIDQFHPARHQRAARDGFQAYCKSCASESFRRHHLKAQYNLELQEYDSLSASQDGLCAICGKSEIASTNVGDKIRSLAIDHDHVTGKVRALLCTKCNTGLGAFEDSPELLQAAIEYIRHHTAMSGSLSRDASDLFTNSD